MKGLVLMAKQMTTLNGNGMQIFSNSEFGEIRTILIDGEPWFVGKDVADILGYQNGSRDINRHVDGEDRQIIQNYQNGTFEIPSRGLIVINESGLYSLIFSSKLSIAKKFTHWVTSEVLPSIRKHGMYAADELLDNPEFAIKVFTALHEERQQRLALEAKVEKLEIKVETDKHKVDFADAVSDSSCLISVEKMAKLLFDEGYPTGRNKYFSWLRDKGYLTDKNLPYQKYIDAGYFRVKEVAKDTRYGVKVFQQTMITGKGQLYLAEKFRQDIQKTAQKAEKINLLNAKKGMNYETNSKPISTIH